ncbi:hypothetical protein ABZ801_30995 [Actinomadura sp. NPDC047616]|uniref:hypothetical protein n=1 Tax=Actinomadura sp. NPDC047616 TaxID=3155914 RepID=UPI0033D41055
MAAMPQFHFDPDAWPPGKELPRELPLGPIALRQADPSAAEPTCLVTIARDGRVCAHMVQGSAWTVLEHGAALQERLRTWEPVTSWPRPATSGVHLDVAARMGEVWAATDTLDQILDRSQWPGWRWQVWHDRYDKQLQEAGGAIVMPARPVPAGDDRARHGWLRDPGP